ncbi:MAG: PQQ-binding-like beta-propeller repeat protein, partial [Chloroflexota bacterium]|nr:PQQ-binding-like beta-propeller repeat protein [Chloroflexota bacterium]
MNASWGLPRRLVALVAATLVACSAPADPNASEGDVSTIADVLTYKGDATRTGAMPGPGPGDRPVPVWEKRYDASITATPLVVAGQLVVAGHDGVVRALDALSGAELWRVELPTGVVATPTIAGGILYVIGDDGVLRTVSLESRERGWEAPGFLPESIVTATGELILAGAAGKIVALTASDGEVVWQSRAGGSDRAALADGRVYVSGDRSGLVTVLDLEGAEQFGFETDGAWVLTPAVVGTDAYLVARDTPGGRNVVLAVGWDGDKNWRWEPPSRDRIHGHAVAGDRVFVATERPTGAVHALDRASGERQWIRAFDHPLLTFPVTADRVVYVAGANEGVIALDAVTGEIQWVADIGNPAEATLTVTGGLLLVTTTQWSGEGTVLAFADPADPRFERLTFPGATAATPTAVASPEADHPVTVLSVDEIEGPSLLLSTSVAPDGTMYVGDMENSRIVVRHPDGRIEMWGERGSGPGQFNFAEVTQNDSSVGVAVSPDGELIAVGDGANHRVQLFDANRRHLRSIGRLGRGAGQFLNPCCLTVDREHRVWVVDTARHDVQVFDEAGERLLTFGEEGLRDGQLRR